MANRKKLIVLTRRSDFLKIKLKGKKQQVCSWMFWQCLHNDGLGLRYGWTIPRQVGSAVIRNRLKRWCREFFRSVNDKSKLSVDINVIIRAHKNKQYYQQLKYDDFIQSMEKTWACLQQNK